MSKLESMNQNLNYWDLLISFYIQSWYIGCHRTSMAQAACLVPSTARPRKAPAVGRSAGAHMVRCKRRMANWSASVLRRKLCSHLAEWIDVRLGEIEAEVSKWFMWLSPHMTSTHGVLLRVILFWWNNAVLCSWFAPGLHRSLVLSFALGQG